MVSPYSPSRTARSLCAMTVSVSDEPPSQAADGSIRSVYTLAER